MDKERLKSLGSIWLGETQYQGLLRFFRNIWKEAERNKYCVFLARRCYNLHELFFSVYGRKIYPLRTKAITENAIILKGKELALFYYEYGKFPRMLIVDDILIHGRSLTGFLYRLEKKIRRELILLGADQSQLDKLYISLMSSISIRVYLESNEIILLNENYRGRLKSVERVDRKAWHSFSQGVSHILDISDVANTSFVLSTEGTLEWGDEFPNKDWTRFAWNLRRKKNTFYYHSLPTGDLGYIVFSVHIREPRTQAGTRWIPFLFTGEPRVHDVAGELSYLMEEMIDRHYTKQFQEIFHQDELAIQQLQLVQLILSVVVFYKFCKDNIDLTSSEISRMGNMFDIDKISRNFSTNTKFSKAIKHLFKEKEFVETCYEMLPYWFYGLRAQEDRILFNPVCSAEDELHLNRITEEKMYQEGLKSEQFAFLIGNDRRAYSPIFDDFSSPTVADFVNQNVFQEFPMYYCLSSLLMLSDSGVTSIKPHGHQGFTEFQVLRAGEQALFCKPRQLALYMPSLILIESVYHSFGNDWVIRQVEEFQDFIKDCYLPLREQVPNLCEFVDGWYKTGASLDAWRIPLLYSIDGKEVFARELTRNMYIAEMRELQRTIFHKCKEFLKSKWQRNRCL